MFRSREGLFMKRDMDLIRELLLKLEDGHLDGNLYSVKPDGLGIEGRSYDELSYHLMQLIDAGLLDGERELSGQFVVRNITWKGHEFLDSIRDPKIWAKTKEGAFAAGGFTLDLLSDLAKGFLKKQIEERTGVKL
jgi:DNA-binding transcriptional ArsR family regulator